VWFARRRERRADPADDLPGAAAAPAAPVELYSIRLTDGEHNNLSKQEAIMVLADDAQLKAEIAIGVVAVVAVADIVIGGGIAALAAGSGTAAAGAGRPRPGQPRCPARASAYRNSARGATVSRRPSRCPLPRATAIPRDLTPLCD
jgi:hypothetical protein